MKMKVNLKTIFYILVLIALFCMTLTVVHLCSKKPSEPKSDSDTVIVHDTVFIFKTETMKIVKPKLTLDTIIRRDTIKSDTVLTFEQKVYSDTICNEKDSILLTSFITGVSAQQDSVKAIWKKHEKVITNTVVVTNTVEAKHKLIEFHPQATFGYNPFNNRFGFVVGFGGSVNF